jgi:hypothetical protein
MNIPELLRGFNGVHLAVVVIPILIIAFYFSQKGGDE